jgi:hypothetical protein
MWTAYAEWANFEPVLGRQKHHRETLWAPDEFGHIFAGDTFEAEYAAASEYRRAAMDKFAPGLGSLHRVMRIMRPLRVGFGPRMDLRSGRKAGWFSLPHSPNRVGDVPRVRLQFVGRGTSSGMARRGRNRIKRFRAGIGRSQC